MNTLQHSAIDIRPYRRARKYIQIGSAIGRFLTRLNDYRIRRRTIRELQRLTDAQLEDIGIPRYEIRRVVDAKLTRKSAESVKAVRKNVEPIGHASREIDLAA